MPLIFDQSAATAQTHILIIGVGGYPYLSGGELERDNQRMFSRIKQLTPAPYSAKAMYDTVMEIHQGGNWIAPLGSVDILISCPPGMQIDVAGHPYKTPTLQAIREAYNGWKSRCDRNEDNVAIFYFCGHGMEKTSDYLLAQDFLESPGIPQEKAFNLNQTRTGFNSCKARNKLFFIDACREITADILNIPFDSYGLDDTPYLGLPGPYTFLQQSAVPRAKAWGRDFEITVYTKALVAALKGQASANHDGTGWIVDTGELNTKMNTLISELNEIDRPPQSCTSETREPIPIIRHSAAPDVDLEVSTMPLQYMADTSFSCYSSDNNTLVSERNAEPSVWNFSVKSGAYKIVAQSITEPKFVRHDPFVANPPKAFRKILFYDRHPPQARQ